MDNKYIPHKSVQLLKNYHREKAVSIHGVRIENQISLSRSLLVIDLFNFEVPCNQRSVCLNKSRKQINFTLPSLLVIRLRNKIVSFLGNFFFWWKTLPILIFKKIKSTPLTIYFLNKSKINYPHCKPHWNPLGFSFTVLCNTTVT